MMSRASASYGALPGKTLPVLGDAHRHQRALENCQLRQVAQGTAQLVAVVQAGADHQLTVHDDAALQNAWIVQTAPPRLLASIVQCSWGSVVWTETLMGLMCRSMMRSVSRSVRFVRVM